MISKLIEVKPREDWDEKCKECPVTGILINQMLIPKYTYKEKLIIFNFVKDTFEAITGVKYERYRT